MGFEDEALYQLSRQSMVLWPDFVKRLEEDSGVTVDYRTEGILRVADDRDEAEALKRIFEFQQSQGLDVAWLSGAEAREIEPFLAPRLPAAVYSKSDHLSFHRPYRGLGFWHQPFDFTRPCSCSKNYTISNNLLSRSRHDHWTGRVR